MTNSDSDLATKVIAWLGSEGYPTEFRTAHCFAQQKFRVRQGDYVRSADAEKPREIDVLADVDRFVDDTLLRVSHIVECKWSKDKPWVVFCGSGARMAPSACIAQSFASALGGAMLWADAGNPALASLSLFETPSVPGFGGRQALSKSNDVFYSAISSVVDAAKLNVESYNESTFTGLTPRPATIPDVAVVAFPMIVIEGSLFRATYDADAADVRVEQTPHARVHWRGSSAWRYHASVDVVTLDHAPAFIAKRRVEVEILLNSMEAKLIELKECFKEKTLAPLRITSGPRGYKSLPTLLRRLSGGGAQSKD